MVQFNGNSTFMKDPHNLQVVVRDGAVDKNGGEYAGVQLDAREPGAENQSNLNLKTKRVEGKDGKSYLNSDIRFTKDQLTAIKEAAGTNKVRDEAHKTTVYGVKANVTKAGSAPGLVIDTSKPMVPSDYYVSPDAVTNQYSSMKAASAANKEARKNAPQPSEVAAQVEQQVAEVNQEQPAF